MNKKNIISVVVLIVVAGLGFYGGMVYGKGQTPARPMGAGAFAGRTGGARGTGGAGGFINGQIISSDATSITVQLATGGSKIIFVDTNTKVSKMTSGALTDLTVGTQVSVTGTANSDGSENAQSVQIRPAMTAGMTTPTSVVK